MKSPKVAEKWSCHELTGIDKDFRVGAMTWLIDRRGPIVGGGALVLHREIAWGGDLKSWRKRNCFMGM